MIFVVFGALQIGAVILAAIAIGKRQAAPSDPQWAYRPFFSQEESN